jgi:hypothetical protein
MSANDYRVSRQWATRPADERFVNLEVMANHARRRKTESSQRVIPTKSLRFEANGEDIVVYNRHEKSGQKFIPGARQEMSNWSFEQLCTRIRCPGEYITRLPAKLAVMNLNECVEQAKPSKVQLLTQETENEYILRAATSEGYGRIWDADVLDFMVEEYGDGVTGRYRVPGEFGKQKPVTVENTTLYMGDRNMFIFLCDEENRVEMADRRNGGEGSLARGFYVWNSEVGKETIGVATFYFDYVCCNRIIWGQEEKQEIRIRHTKFAPERFTEEILPGLTKFTEGSTVGITTAIDNAKKVKFQAPDEVAVFLGKSLGFPKKTAGQISMVHFLEEERPIENMWDATVAMTAFARSVPYQDERVAIEIKAGEILKRFAA